MLLVPIRMDDADMMRRPSWLAVIQARLECPTWCISADDGRPVGRYQQGLPFCGDLALPLVSKKELLVQHCIARMPLGD